MGQAQFSSFSDLPILPLTISSFFDFWPSPFFSAFISLQFLLSARAAFFSFLFLFTAAAHSLLSFFFLLSFS
jgi:hypothetical protein